ncbi:MAG: FRG domain-containing protein [Clostridia bacterium]|nr:FRG domain-containing protein [Clostridia bacterium]
MQEIIISGWDDLQRNIFDDVWDEKVMRYRDSRIYRGAADREWDLSPSLNRVCGHDLSLETHVFRQFRKYGYAELAGYEGFWSLLPVAQHHGLPTRLLDWTYSPMVAAHFATEDTDYYDRDGVIWQLDVKQFHSHLPSMLRSKLEEHDSSIFTIGMLEKTVQDFRMMQSLSDEPFALFFEPSSMIDRIVNQYALFSVVSDPAVLLSEIIDSKQIKCRKLIIPKEVKLEIRDKLDYINISERMIYPGLDGVCKWITRRYAALGPVYNAGHGGHEE